MRACPRLARVVRKHHEDEVRHNRMLLACVERIGVDPGPVPEDFRIGHRLDALLGGFTAQLQAGERGVMEAYALLLVLEERAVKEFPLLIQALERVDPKSASVLREVVADEARHVKYARAICERYAPDEGTLACALERLREVENRAFVGHNAALLRHASEKGLLAVGRVERLLWRAMATVAALSGERGEAVHTTFEPSAAA